MLVNNAGTGSFKPLVETTAAESDAVSAVNVAEAVLFCLSQRGQVITDIVTLRRRDATPFA